MIETVRVNVTLKAGKNIWEEGEVLHAPLPPEIQNEVYKNTGTVSVVKGDMVPQNKLVFVAERVKEGASTMTTMVPKPDPVSKPKPKLLRKK